MKLTRLLIGTLYVALLLVMGFATFLQQQNGVEYASEKVYATPWFFILWLVLALLSIGYMTRRRLYKRLSVGCLHVALLIILAGAALTWFTSSEGMIHLRQGETTSYFQNKEGLQPLPFSLQLDSFRIQYYPGSQAPADFASYLVIDPNKQSSQAIISMNNILQRDGYRIFQSSFDPDLEGTILTVRYDPYGTPLTYFGYLLLALSMLWVLLDRRETFHRLLKTLASHRMLLLLLLIMQGSITGVQARSIPTINQEEAKKAARMQVVFNDRVTPFSTLAHEFTQKIYGKPSYQGLSAEQVVYGWLARPEVWKNEPMIKIKDGALRRRLGVEGKYATFAQLFDAEGTYKLSTILMEKEFVQSKALRELDEKVGLIVMLTSDRLIQPLPEGTEPLSEERVSAEILYNTIPFSKLLFMVCLTLGFLSFFLMLYESASSRRVPYIHGVLAILLCLTLLIHLFGYCLRWYISGHVPLSNGYETMQFLALSLLIITLVLHRRFTFVMPFGFLLSGFALLVSWLGQMNPQITPLMPVLRSPLLSSHVCAIMIAYALLAFMMLNGIYAMILSLLHKDNNVEGLTLLSQVMLYPAVFLLAVGIFLGAVWANVSWGRYWSWDPKEVWALITLMVYAVPLHAESLPRFRKPFFLHAYLVLAFLTVLMTYFGVNYFLGGMHSYA